MPTVVAIGVDMLFRAKLFALSGLIFLIMTGVPYIIIIHYYMSHSHTIKKIM